MDKQQKYAEIKKLTEVPLSKRVQVENCRGNKVKPRRFHHTAKTAEKARALFAEMQKQIDSSQIELISSLAGPNFYIPFRPSGPYCGAVMALYLLGANSYHELCVVKNKTQEWMSKVDIDENGQSAWQRFDIKLPREGATNTKDVTGRIIDNMRVLQRLGGQNPYGHKLSEIGCCVDIKKSADGKLYYCLNTHFDNNKMAPQLNTAEYFAANKEARANKRKLNRAKKLAMKQNLKVIGDFKDKKTTIHLIDAEG